MRPATTKTTAHVDPLFAVVPIPFLGAGCASKPTATVQDCPPP
jgi:hypothetical protein